MKISSMYHRIIWLILSCIKCEICAFSIKCEFDYYELMEQSIFDKTKLYYTCFGKILNGKSDDIMTDLYGTNLSAKETEYFCLNDQDLKSFPKNSETFFPNLQVIDVSHNSITEISNAHLQPHQLLTTLLAPHNQISVIDSNIFNGLSNLRIVDFSYNKVKQVGYDIKLPTNGELYFLKNPCIDMKALNPGDIKNLKSVFRSQCPFAEMNGIEDRISKLEITQTMLEGKIVNIITESGKEKLEKLEEEIIYLRNKTIELEKIRLC